MNLRSIACFVILILAASCINNIYATIWKVGPTKTYTLPSQVSVLVADGDIVEMDPAVYIDCATWAANNLILRGVGGKAQIKNKVCGGKGIWNLEGLNTTIENIEFSGATNPDQNGAGLRGLGGGFTVRNCYFHNNNNGILASPSGPLSDGQGEVLIEYSEFDQNGFGDGLSHNIYIGDFAKLTLRFSYIHRAKVGHEVKSRAYNNYILYNRISDETSDASRSIDLPNGGNSFVIGNVIEQGAASSNSNIIGYGLEGLINPTINNLTLINNTIVNRKTNGAFIEVFEGTGKLKVINTIFAGVGTFLTGIPLLVDSSHNLNRTSISAIGFKDQAHANYELVSTSPAINRGIDPGYAGCFSLYPIAEYVHPLSKRDRVTNVVPEIGSYEFQTGATLTSLEENNLNESTCLFPNPFQRSFSVYLPNLQ